MSFCLVMFSLPWWYLQCHEDCERAITMIKTTWKLLVSYVNCLSSLCKLIELLLFILQLLKAQTKYLGRNWRKSNMKTMSAIYQKVRHRLNDDWAYGNGGYSFNRLLAIKFLARHWSKWVSWSKQFIAQPRSQGLWERGCSSSSLLFILWTLLSRCIRVGQGLIPTNFRSK